MGKRLIAAVAAISMLLICAAAAIALAAGDFDPSFSGDGVFVEPIGDPGPLNRPGMQFQAVALQPDGKIIAAGDATPSQLGVVRLHPDGTLDNSFSGDGKMLHKLGLTGASDSVSPVAVAIQPDGKIVVAGSVYIAATSTQRAFIARLTDSGEFDNSFDSDGYLIRDYRAQTQVTAMKLQPAGKILIVGYGPFLARVDESGAPDTSFGTAGKLEPQLGIGANAVSNIKDVKLQPDGKIVVTGEASDNDNPEAHATVVARFDADGKGLDPGFGSGGKLITRFGLGDTRLTRPLALALAADGRIVVVGETQDGGALIRYFIGRINADGAGVDSGFANGGMLEASGPSSSLNDVIVQPDGKVLAGGVAQNGSDGRSLLVLRTTVNGAYDSSFSGDGMAFAHVASPGWYEDIKSLALDPAGRVVGGGSTIRVVNGNPDTHAVAVRVITNLAPSAAFTATPSTATVGQPLAFDGAGSSDSDGTIAAYAWDFGDGSTATGSPASHAYAAPGTYSARLTVTDDYGMTASSTQAVTVAPAAMVPAPTTGPTATNAPTPSLTGLTIRPKTFIAATRGGSIAARTGATVRYTASHPSTSTFRIQRARPGRRSGKRCVAPTRRNRSAKKCTRFVTLRGRFSRKDAVGGNRFRFTGRLNRRTLVRGIYRLRATPRLGRKAGATVAKRFTIAPPRNRRR